VVDEIALDGLHDAFSLAVNEDFLDAEESFFDSAWVIDVRVVVKVLD